MAFSSPRMLLVDENIRDSGGHYLELASLLMDGARHQGYAPTLAVNHAFSPSDNTVSDDTIVPAFQSRRMNYWSMGVDGHSHVGRDTQGRLTGGTLGRRNLLRVRDSLSRRQRNPQQMIRQWSDDFVNLVQSWKPGDQDQILINTADDFVILAIANALQRLPSDRPLNINAIFHFAVFASNVVTPRAMQFGQQVNEAVRQSQPHRISMFATTESLAAQLDAVGMKVSAVPYPTRKRQLSARKADGPLKILMAGMPRAEKGRDQIRQLLSQIYSPLLCENQFQFSMQMRPRAWKRLIPPVLHDDYAKATESDLPLDSALQTSGPLEIVSSDLPGNSYHDWLGTADVGLFLYAPERYVARCSGVLLEMMVAGVPVIVPAKCWLDDQLEQAGGDGSIGFRYHCVDEIPQLLRRIRTNYDSLRNRSAAYANVMQERHTGANTIRQMGLETVSMPQRLAS